MTSAPETQAGAAASFEGGALLAMRMLAEIARAPDAPRNNHSLARALGVDAEFTMTVGLAHLAELGFISAAKPGDSRVLGPKALRAWNWTERVTLRPTPRGIAWARQTLDAIWPLVLAALDRDGLALDAPGAPDARRGDQPVDTAA